MTEPARVRTAPSDPFEAETPVEGAVLHRDKVVARKLALLMLVMAVMFTATSVAYLMGWPAHSAAFTRWITYAVAPLCLFVGLTRTVVRTTVTTREVRIQYGLWGPRIPLEAISRAEVVALARLPKGVELCAPNGLKGVLIDWTDATGKARRILVGSEDPATLGAQIAQARAANAAGVRVEAGATADNAELEAAAGGAGRTGRA